MSGDFSNSGWTGHQVNHWSGWDPQPFVQYKMSITNNEEEEVESISKIKQAAKGLSKSEKLLRKHGVIDRCGDLTQDGRELLLDVLFKENRDKLVALAEEVEKESKKK